MLQGYQALTKQVDSAKQAKEKLERDYERFRRKEELQRKIQVDTGFRVRV
jgi:hypothetical protein